MQWFAHQCFQKLRLFYTSNIMTFCQIFEVASRVRQKIVDHRSLRIEKCSVQEKKVVGDYDYVIRIKIIYLNIASFTSEFFQVFSFL